MSWTPLVSVVTIFRDAERFFRDAMDSVFAQSYRNWELLLVDDGSRDHGSEMAMAMAAGDPLRVRYLHHPAHENRGMSASRNLGIEEARGELVAFLDADDVWIPTKLAEQVAIFAEEPRAALVYGTRELWRSWSGGDGEDSIVGHRIAGDRLFSPPRLFLLTFGRREATVPSCSDMMFRRAAAVRVGGFENAFRGMYDDQAFLVKLYLREPVWVSTRCWTRYRQHADSCVFRWSESPGADAVTDGFTKWMEDYVRDWRGSDRIGRAARRTLWWHRHPMLSRILCAISRRSERYGFGA